MVLDKELVEKCINYGAHKAFVIDVDHISFDENLRNYCKMNYCGSYGKNYACPPSVGDVDEVIAQAKQYKKALVFQTVNTLEDSFDLEGMNAAALMHTKVADTIDKDFKTEHPHYLQLTAGGCSVCSICAQVEGEPCRYPDQAISSLEAYCMNVANLAELCHMNYINGQNTVTYFGAFLFD